MHDRNTNPPPRKRPTILLLEEDDDARPGLSQNLRREGYRLLVAADYADALEWVASVSIPADLVLINLVGKSTEETLQAGRNLRQQAKYDGHTPLVVLPEKYHPEREGTNEQVSEQDWVCYYEDGEQLQSLLASLTSKNP